jgi:hypothetical protein
MALKDRCPIDIPAGLLDAIRSFPLEREVEHCGIRMTVSPFDFYAECPQCGTRIKVRSLSGTEEIEDVFDAVFEWMNRPMAQEVAKRRLKALEEETELERTHGPPAAGR